MACRTCASKSAKELSIVAPSPQLTWRSTLRCSKSSSSGSQRRSKRSIAVFTVPSSSSLRPAVGGRVGGWGEGGERS